MKRKWLVVGIVLLFIGTAIIPTDGQKIEKQSFLGSRGNTLYVGGSGPGNYSKIQDAINDSHDGNTVFVYSGWYNESILINKSIVVSGQDRNTTFIGGGNSLFSIIVLLFASNIEFSGFTVQTLVNGSYTTGIVGDSCSYCQIRDNYVRMCESGIGMDSSDSVFISKNIIQNCTDGIWISHSKNVTIKENLIEGNGETQYGISVVLTSHKNSIIKNNITNYGCGIILGRAYFTSVKENNFIRNEEQAFFSDSHFSVWSRNYWNESRRLPKAIFGWVGGSINSFSVINIDWRPAKEPYDIPGMR